jgi:hypothetical protein
VYIYIYIRERIHFGSKVSWNNFDGALWIPTFLETMLLSLWLLWLHAVLAERHSVDCMGIYLYFSLSPLAQDFGSKLLRSARNLTGAWLTVIGGK